MNRGFLSLLISILLLDSLSAENPVHFADENLKAAVEDEL